MVKGNNFIMFNDAEEAKRATPCHIFPLITEGEKAEIFNRYFGDIENEMRRMGIK